MFDFVLDAETGHFLTCKVSYVVENDSAGESKATHYVLLEKLDNQLHGDFGEWHHFDPFGEVVGGYH